MKQVLFLLTILFSTVASFAAVTPNSFSAKNEKSFDNAQNHITIKIGKIEEKDLKNLEETLVEIVSANFINVTECTITITLEASVGVIKVTGSASMTAPTCKEAAMLAVQGAKDALAAARKALM